MYISAQQLSAVPYISKGSKHVRVDADGTAALGICESLLIALTDAKIIANRGARDLLTDVVTSQQEASVTSTSPDKHHAVIAIVQRILAGKDGMRGPTKTSRP
jgi:hypothetical protein